MMVTEPHELKNNPNLNQHNIFVYIFCYQYEYERRQLNKVAVDLIKQIVHMIGKHQVDIKFQSSLLPVMVHIFLEGVSGGIPSRCCNSSTSA